MSRAEELQREPFTFTPKNAKEFEMALGNPLWRLSHLYKVVSKQEAGDEEGKVVTFVPNAAQVALIEELWYRNIILKARQLGFSTFIAILFLDYALFEKDVRAGIIAHTDDAAKVIFRDKIRFGYDNLPEELREVMPLKAANASELVFGHNNSSIRVSTSMRSGTINYLHVSEFGKICARFPHRAAEVITGSIPAVPSDGVVFIESTAEGRDGEFFKMCQRAEANRNAGKKLTRKDYRFLFFAWWKAPEYRMSADGVVITDKDNEYFAQVEASEGITLDAEQRAWYCATRDEDFAGDQERMYQEYPSTSEEAFAQSTEGTYFAQQLALARKESRITTVPWVPNEPVNTFWDIGLNDEMAIWFHQRVGMQNRFIRYYENSGESFNHYVAYMQSLGYVWGTHYLPHDGDTQRLGTVRNWTPRQMLEDLGLRNVEVVPRIDQKINAIQMARDVFGQCWFDETDCKDGLIHLELYRKEWNDRLGVWKDTPRHDAHSNGADAFMQFAQGYTTPHRTMRRRRAESWRTA